MPGKKISKFPEHLPRYNDYEFSQSFGEDGVAVHRLLSVLGVGEKADRSRFILVNRYELYGVKKKTYEQLSEMLGVSAPGIGRNNDEAINLLRNPIYSSLVMDLKEGKLKQRILYNK